MKKQIIISSSCVFLMFVGLYLFISPYITLYNMKNSIQQKNAQELADNVDFPALQSSIKNEFNSIILAAMTKNDNETENSNDDSDAKKIGTVFGGALASLFVDKFIDLYITPDGLINLFSNLITNSTTANNNTAINQGTSDDTNSSSSSSITYGYTSLNTFTVILDRGQDNNFQFVLLRSGFGWKLSKLVIPTDALKKILSSN